MKESLGIIMVVVAFLLAGCGEMANHNANSNATMANANANANTNTMVARENANRNENTSLRRAPSREDYQREKERYDREAKDSGSKIGTGLNDGWLWVKARYELAAADDLRDSTINVDVDNEVVTLRGTVATPAQKARAEAIVKPLEGVKAVKNLLKVSPSGNTNHNT